MKHLICWWDGFAGTWLDPGMWATRFRLLLVPGGPPLAWPGVTYDGHLYDIDNRSFHIEGDRELEWTPCARCDRLIYTGWRSFPR